MRRVILFYILLCLPSLLFAQELAEKGRQYRIGTVNWVGWSFLQVAEELGFWKELGVDVKVVHYPMGILIHDAMRVGEIDFSMAMVGMMIGDSTEHRSIRIIATTDWSNGGDKILVRKGFDLKENLGAVLGFYVEGPSLKYFCDSYLKTIGLSLTQFKIVIMYPDELAAQFKTGRLKAAVMYDPYALEMEQAFDGITKARTSDFPGCIREVIYTFEENLKTMPHDDVVKICRGIVRANVWINKKENRTAYYKILNNKTFKGYDPFSDKELEQMLRDVVIHPAKDLLEENRSGGKLERHLLKLFAFMKEIGDVDNDLKPKDYFESQYILEALELEGVR